jgi:hypothetical protein
MKVGKSTWTVKNSWLLINISKQKAALGNQTAEKL